MTPVEILKAARAKIEDPAHWCQGALGYAADSRVILVASDVYRNAVRCCAVGALGWVTAEPFHEASELLEQAAVEMGFKRGLCLASAELNDSTDHATVLKMFDHAIKLAEAPNA